MKTEQTAPQNIDEYIATFPAETQKIMEELRTTIKAAAPEAKEKISYKMAAFDLKGNLVLFAGWKNHIGFYGTSHAIQEALKNEVSIYANEKGSLKFPFDEPLPVNLISKIVRLRVAENLKRAEIISSKQ